MKKFNIYYFGEVAEKVGKSQEELTLVENHTSGLLNLLQKKYDLSSVSLKIAINQELIDEEQEINDQDEIAVLSPFAGG